MQPLSSAPHRAVAPNARRLAELLLGHPEPTGRSLEALADAIDTARETLEREPAVLCLGRVADLRELHRLAEELRERALGMAVPHPAFLPPVGGPLSTLAASI